MALDDVGTVEEVLVDIKDWFGEEARGITSLQTWVSAYAYKEL